MLSIFALAFSPEIKDGSSVKGIDPFGCHKKTDCSSCIDKVTVGVYYPW